MDDQAGRLTFTETMAGAIFHLLGYREGDMEPAVPAPYGLYNCINSGDAASWAQIAAMVFERVNGNGDKVQPVSTADYYANCFRQDRSFMGGTQNFQAWHCKFSCSARHAA